MISRMEIGDLSGRVVERRVAEGPMDLKGNSFGIEQLDAGGMEERHREVTGEEDVLLVKADADREGLDEILAVVTIVERSSAEEECDGRVNRGERGAVPENAEAGAA